MYIFTNWRRRWRPTPVLLPGKSHGQRSLVRILIQKCVTSLTTDLGFRFSPSCCFSSSFSYNLNLSVLPTCSEFSPPYLYQVIINYSHTHKKFIKIIVCFLPEDTSFATMTDTTVLPSTVLTNSHSCQQYKCLFCLFEDL